VTFHMIINIMVTVVWGYHRANLCPYERNAIQTTQHYWFRDWLEFISGGGSEITLLENDKKTLPLAPFADKKVTPFCKNCPKLSFNNVIYNLYTPIFNMIKKVPTLLCLKR